MRPYRNLFLILTVGAVLLGSLGVAPAGARRSASGSDRLPCTDELDAAVPLSIRVKGENATGRYAAPSQTPTTLVVINHGYSFDSYAWQWIMSDMAREHGVLVVAMDNRGTVAPGDFDGDGNGDFHDREGARWDGSPKARGWAIAAGAEDTVKITKRYQSWCPSIRETVLFSVSIGAGTGGLALADSRGLFDYWFSVEGVTNLIEEYHGACLLAQTGNDFVRAACEDMAAETNGGDPEELRERTLVFRSDEIAASGIKGAVFVSPFEDGQAPYDQTRQVQLALSARGIPTDMFSIARRDKTSERGTTLTSYLGNADSRMAGHATEVSDTHIVMRVAYKRLWALIEKDVVPGPYREFLVDGDTTYPQP